MASLHKLRIADGKLSLFDLPNEIMIYVLDLLPTNLLLQTRSICRRFQHLTLRIIHGRLLRAASLPDRKLILECYHPSAQYTAPYLQCDYLGTPGLGDEIEVQSPIHAMADSQTASEGTLRRLYSHFRPIQEDLGPKIYRSHPAGDIPGSRSSEVANRVREHSEGKTVTQIVSLEAHELFVQLCFLVAVVQTDPRRGFFLSLENVIDKTLRIFREWLSQRAKAVKEFGTSVSCSANAPGGEADGMLWVDQNRKVGLRVRVEERKWRREVPILLHRDEDEAVSYTLELEELIVNTTHLLLAMENQLLVTGEGYSQAVIFGNFTLPTVPEISESTN